MTYYIHGFHVLKAALNTVPHQIKMLYLLEKRQDKRTEELVQLAKEHDIPIEWLPRDLLNQRLPDVTHQGIIAACDKPNTYDENFIKDLCRQKSEDKTLLFLILDGIQDPHNLGACLRTANAFGVNAVIIPRHRSVQLTSVVHKVASGAALVTPVVQVKNLAQTLDWLKKQNVWLVGTDLASEMPLKDVDLKGDIALVLGNEAKGLRQLTREKCDFLTSIPMQGTVESLNVSVATGVCLYEAIRQRTQPDES